jgi:iron(III) transport system ATP-binding protein
MPHQISGGQQQRVALARALAARPDLLLLDEPFSNLDPAIKARVRAEVRQIISSLGITAIFVTHDQEEALSLAEEVAVMLEGRIVQAGKPAEVYLQPVTRAVAEFLGDTNFLHGTLHDGLLQCDLGSLPIQVPLEGEVDVMIRPENLTLASEGGQSVEITHCDYYGHDQMVTVRLQNGRLLKVRSQNAPQVTPGHRLSLRLAGDVVVFPPSG